MDKIEFEMNEKGHGAFYIMGGEERVGEMLVSISGSDMRVYHTKVVPKAEGKGLAKEILNAMVAHARKNNLKVFALCPYVHAQFSRHGDEYADVWAKD